MLSKGTENCQQENEMLLRRYYIFFGKGFVVANRNKFTLPTIENGIAIVDFNW